mmetsp:Transcript_50314/g.100044  ORF Transcript_50314/g.100044 Transcript_50314/m.100044 type:complete len:297 (-) Transcript_50314:474-1364(-)
MVAAVPSLRRTPSTWSPAGAPVLRARRARNAATVATLSDSCESSLATASAIAARAPTAASSKPKTLGPTCAPARFNLSKHHGTLNSLARTSETHSMAAIASASAPLSAMLFQPRSRSTTPVPIPALQPDSIQASHGRCNTRPSASAHAPTQVMRFHAKPSCSNATLLAMPLESAATQASFNALPARSSTRMPVPSPRQPPCRAKPNARAAIVASATPLSPRQRDSRTLVLLSNSAPTSSAHHSSPSQFPLQSSCLKPGARQAPQTRADATSSRPWRSKDASEDTPSVVKSGASSAA